MIKIFATILIALLVSMFVFAESAKVVTATPTVIIVTMPVQSIQIKKTPEEIIDEVNITVVERITKSKNKKEIECVATNVYQESRNQPTIGKIAVAFVPLTRAKD